MSIRDNIHYLTGERVYAAGTPRDACTSAAMREGWDDARSAAACADIEATPS